MVYMGRGANKLQANSCWDHFSGRLSYCGLGRETRVGWWAQKSRPCARQRAAFERFDPIARKLALVDL